MNESIFSNGITEHEIEILRIHWTNAEEYYHNTSVREIFNDLYNLFRIRGDEQAANYLLRNSLMNNFVSMSQY